MPLNQSREAEKETVKDDRQVMPYILKLTCLPFANIGERFLFLKK